MNAVYWFMQQMIQYEVKNEIIQYRWTNKTSFERVYFESYYDLIIEVCFLTQLIVLYYFNFYFKTLSKIENQMVSRYLVFSFNDYLDEFSFKIPRFDIRSDKKFSPFGKIMGPKGSTHK